MEELVQQVLDQYGLVGLVLFLLVTGPGAVLLQVYRGRQKNETDAQALIHELLLEEHQHADELEGELNQTTQQLLEAKEEVFRLRMDLVESQYKMEGMPEVSREMEEMTNRLDVLEGQMSRVHDQLQRLVSNGNTRGVVDRLQSLLETGVGQMTGTEHSYN